MSDILSYSMKTQNQFVIYTNFIICVIIQVRNQPKMDHFPFEFRCSDENKHPTTN